MRRATSATRSPRASIAALMAAANATDIVSSC